MRGVLNVCKPAGRSSYDVIRRLKSVVPARDPHNGRRTAIGHAGTLDPMATGVLLLLLGEATKVVGLLLKQPKTYEAEVLFGIRTDTDDVTGKTVEEKPPPEVSAGQVCSALVQFTGRIMQTPPVFSALKLGGQPSYKLARTGRPVQTEPRPVTIHEIELLELTLPRARLRAIVSSGTYIRSLARDLGAALGTVATLSRLVRTRVGRFTIDDAADPAGITGENITDRLVSVREALPDVPILPIDTETARRLLCGQVVALPKAAGFSGQGFAVTADGRFLAIVNRDEQKLQVERIIYAD